MGGSGARADCPSRLESGTMGRWLFGVALWVTATSPAPRPPRDRVVVPGGPFTQGSTRGEDDERPTRQVTREDVRDRPNRSDARRVQPLRRGGALPRTGAGGRRRQSAGHERRLERRAGLLQVRGRAASDGGRVGKGGPRHRRARVPVGERRRLRARRTGAASKAKDRAPARTRGTRWPSGRTRAAPAPTARWTWAATSGSGWPTSTTPAASAASFAAGRAAASSSGPRAPNRNAWAPGHRDGDLGFRCAGPK